MLWYLTDRIFKFWSYWDLSAGLGETSRAAETSAQALQGTQRHILNTVVLRVAQPQGISFIIFVFVSHKICYIIICHVLSKTVYIYTYRYTGITETDSATGSTDLEDPTLDRHRHIIRNTHSIFPSSWSHSLLPSFHISTQFVWFLMHSCQAFIDPCNFCRSSWPGISSYPLTLSTFSSSQNRSFSIIPIRCHMMCGAVLMMGCLPSSFTVWPHSD